MRSRTPISGRPEMYHHTGAKDVAAQIRDAFRASGVSQARHRFAFDAVTGTLEITHGGKTIVTPMACWYDGAHPRIAIARMMDGEPAVLSLPRAGLRILATGKKAVSNPLYRGAFALLGAP